MLRWIILRHCARPLRQPCLILSSRKAPLIHATGIGGARGITSSKINRQDEQLAGASTPKWIEPPNFKKLKGSRRLDAWLALLEPTLPPHLRTQNRRGHGAALSPDQIFQVLSAAERISYAARDCGVFSYMAYEKGRWNLVVWLVKHLVESFAAAPSAGRTQGLLCTWKNDTALDELTRAPIDLQSEEFLQNDRYAPSDNVSLREDSESRSDGLESRQSVLTHEVLGMVWRGLGEMTMACADDEIRPEILEIIAYLHHEGFMPSSIYDSKPSSDPTAIQQSPMLNMLSSRILKSLSDAAWRAHERLVVEEAKNQGGSQASSGPELRGTAYRVRVTGLKPEVWLELILWSCLHGGWISDGTRILGKLYSLQGRHQWKPLSWRLLSHDQPKNTRDWEMVEYLFNNWAPSSMDLEEPLAPASISRTISSELVNAYVDASLSIIRLFEDGRGRSISQTVEFFRSTQQFLGRSGLALGAGSWDAVLLRLFDLQDNALFRPKLFDEVMRLSPAMGKETAASNAENLPDYVFDGTAGVFGLFHRALYDRIKHADIEGALRLFTSLQERADENKRQSVADFLQKQVRFATSEDGANTGQFTGNYGRIDYPAFYVQIPPTILGPFLELVTDAKAYDFGKWLLYSEEIDGPIIPESRYGDASITPALVRFATETGDKQLLSRLIKIRVDAASEQEPTLPRKVLQSFLESQINLRRWDAAIKILRHSRDVFGYAFNTMTLCHLLRVCMLLHRQAEAGEKNAEDDAARAQGLFQHLVRGGYERANERPDFIQEQVDNLLVVLARLGGDWTAFSVNTQLVRGYRVFNLSSKAFNLVLEGVVDAYGSQTGRKLIEDFWSFPVRHARLQETESDKLFIDPAFSSFGKSLPRIIRQQRAVIRYPGYMKRNVVIFGGLRPDLMTIRIVMKKAIEELLNQQTAGYEEGATQFESANSAEGSAKEKGDELSSHLDPAVDMSPVGMIVWSARCLKRLGMAVDDLQLEMKQSLSSSTFDEVLCRDPTLLQAQQGSEEEDAGDDESDQIPIEDSDRQP